MVGMGTSKTLRHYIGHLDGELVATSTILLSDGVAGLYMVATMPEARGKGVGSYTTVAPSSGLVTRVTGPVSST
jgi:hypothetical protein